MGKTLPEPSGSISGLRVFFFFLPAFLAGCVQPFSLDISTGNSDLVVEGFINAGSGPTQFHLSRVNAINDTSQPVYELHAQVSVLDSLGNSFPLRETGLGLYEASSLNLDPLGSYRVYIRTANGASYQSDLVQVQYSPPIDRVNWNIVDDGVQIYVSTHDSLNRSPYYKWQYNETWEYQAYFTSFYSYLNGQFVARPPDQMVKTCWISDSSESLLLGARPSVTSVNIYQFPLTYIPPHAEQLNILYSIDVKQYALSPSAYNYWKLLQTTTQLNGSVFDPQPVTALGNIHCITHPGEPVIGYVAAGQLRESRIFIHYLDLPRGWARYADCGAPLIVPESQYAALFGTYTYVPLYPDDPNRYFGTVPECADCTAHHHGTNVKPAFWP